MPSRSDVQIRILKRPDRGTAPVPLFSIVRNERYLLPHLLAHYRAAGVHEFWFLDDASDDGTAEFLLQQDDCGVLGASAGFGELIDGMRFGEACKDIVPGLLFRDRWVLTVDADEFLLLPGGHATVPDLVAALTRHRLTVARALMVDFFPTTLREGEEGAPAASPFRICPFFDAWSHLSWPAGTRETTMSLAEGVRPRIIRKLHDDGHDFGPGMETYGYANMRKVPLALWHEGQRMLSAHWTSDLPGDEVQLVLAHFKFAPGHMGRTREAVQRAVHWNGAIEYRILDAANRKLADWPLAGPRTRRYEGPQSFDGTGLLYSRISPAR